MKRIRCLSIGYKKELIDTCYEKNIDVVVLIDEFEDLLNIPEQLINETRVFTKTNIDDFFTYSELLKNNYNSFDCVISPFEFTNFNASILSMLFKCEYITPYQSVLFRDKLLQKNIIKNSNKLIKIANFYNLDDFLLQEQKQFPVIIKPSSGTGSYLTFKVNNIEELQIKAEQIRNQGKEFNSIIVEEFVIGKEYYADGWISNKKINFAIGKYCNNILDTLNSDIDNNVKFFFTPYASNEILYKQISKILKDFFEICNINEGVFHLEFFVNQDQIIFGECGLRIGGTMVESYFKHIFNISITDILLDIHLKKDINIHLDISNINKIFGQMFIPVPKNDIKSLPSIDKVLNKYPSIKDIKYNWKPKQKLPNPKETTSNNMGLILVETDNQQNLIKEFKNIEISFNNYYKTGAFI